MCLLISSVEWIWIRIRLDTNLFGRIRISKKDRLSNKRFLNFHRNGYQYLFSNQICFPASIVFLLMLIRKKVFLKGQCQEILNIFLLKRLHLDPMGIKNRQHGFTNFLVFTKLFNCKIQTLRVRVVDDYYCYWVCKCIQ